MANQTAGTLLGVVSSKLRRGFSFLWQWEARFKGVKFEGGVEFAGRPLISVAPGGEIVIGDGVRVASAVRANPLGLSQPSVLRALNRGARLVLGRGVGVSGSVLCAGAAIEVGEQTLIGAGAMLIDNDFHVAADDWGWKADPNARPIRI